MITVTVLHLDSAWIDALLAVAFILPHAEAWALIAKSGAEAIWVTEVMTGEYQRLSRVERRALTEGGAMPNDDGGNCRIGGTIIYSLEISLDCLI